MKICSQTKLPYFLLVFLTLKNAFLIESKNVLLLLKIW